MTDDLAALHVTDAQLAALAGVTPRRIRQLAEAGTLTRVARNRFLLGDAFAALVEEMAGGDKASELTAERVRKLRADASTTAWVGGRLAGAIMVVTHSIWDEHLTGPFIIDLFIDPHARGKGIGRALVQHAIATCCDAGDHTLSLRFGQGTSDAAMRIYQRLGFRPVG